MDPFKLIVPLTKYDAREGLAYGVMAASVPDKSGEIMDWETGKAAIKSWSDSISAATGGENLGNVRLMHGKVAAGKLVKIEFDDAAQEVRVCAKAVTTEARTLLDERVITGFSIGGGYAKRWTDPGNRALKRYTPTLTEVSFVDNPCIPTAVIDMVKADGTEVRAPWGASAEPTRDEVRGRAAELAKDAGKPDRVNDFVLEARLELLKSKVPALDDAPVSDAPAPTQAEAIAALIKAAHPDLSDADLAAAVLDVAKSFDEGHGETVEDLAKSWTPPAPEDDDPAAALERLIAEDDDPLGKKAPKPYGDVPYADPKNGKYPVDTAAHIRAAWSYINMPKNQKGYTPEEVSAIKGKIVSAWKSKISEDGPPSADKMALFGETNLSLTTAVALLKALEDAALEKGFWTVRQLSGVLDQLADIACSVVWEERWEEDDDSTLPQSTLDLVAATRALIVDMVNEETAELMSQCEANGGDFVTLLAPTTPGPVMEMAAKVGPLHKLDTGLMEKVGRRNSSADQKHVQAMHDHSQALGAKCDSGNCDKVAGADELAKNRRIMGAAVSKMEKLGGQVRELTEARNADQATIADLTKQVERLGSMPGAPKGVLMTIGKGGDTGLATTTVRATEGDNGPLPDDPVERRRIALERMAKRGQLGPRALPAPGGGY